MAQSLALATTQEWRALLNDTPLPSLVVDGKAFYSNLQFFSRLASHYGKPLRLCTKSIRHPDLIQGALDHGCTRLMTYTPEDTLFWAKKGVKDILLAYPLTRAADATVLLKALELGAAVKVVVDSLEHVAFWRQWQQPVGLVIDVDMSWRTPIGLHFGVRRSPVHSVVQVRELMSQITAPLFCAGAMGYEAQIAGVADASPYASWLNPLKRWIKNRSRPRIRKLRREVAALLPNGSLFNGGGTGSAQETLEDPAVTELAVGSGLLLGHLFDHYLDLCRGELSLTPSLFLVLPVTRFPAPGMVTCQGGGVIASGPVGADRQPIAHCPKDLKILAWEGFGEVQTPFKTSASLQLGDPVILRPAKSGESLAHGLPVLLYGG